MHKPNDEKKSRFSSPFVKRKGSRRDSIRSGRTRSDSAPTPPQSTTPQSAPQKNQRTDQPTNTLSPTARRKRFKTFKQQSNLSMLQLLKDQQQHTQDKPHDQYLIIRADQLFDPSADNRERLSRVGKKPGEFDLALNDDAQTIYPFAAGCIQLLYELTHYYGVRLVLIDHIRLQSQESLLEQLFEQAAANGQPKPSVYYKVFCGDKHAFFDADSYANKHHMQVKAMPQDMGIDEIARAQDSLGIPDEHFYFHQVICNEQEQLSEDFSIWTPTRHNTWDFEQFYHTLWGIYRVMVADRTPHIEQFDLQPDHLEAFQNLIQYGSCFAWMLRKRKNPPPMFHNVMNEAQLAAFTKDLEYIGKQFSGLGYCDWQGLTQMMAFIKAVDEVSMLQTTALKEGLKRYTEELKKTGQDGGAIRWLDNNSKKANFLIDFNRSRSDRIRQGIPGFLTLLKKKIEPELTLILAKGQDLEARGYQSASFEMYLLYSQLKAHTNFIFQYIDLPDRSKNANETYRRLYQILETAHDCMAALENATHGQLAKHRGYKQLLSHALLLFISVITLVPAVLLYLGVIHLPRYKTDTQQVLDSTKEIFEDPYIIEFEGVKIQ